MDRRVLVKTYDNRIFYALCVLDFLLWMEWSISTSMLPLYVHDLGGSPLEVSLVFSVFAGVCVFTYPFWGSVSDYLGRRKVLIVFGMASLFPIFLLMANQKEVLHLILLRGSTAIFKGAVVPTTWALVADISPPERVGGNMGFLSSIETAGIAFGPVIGGLVTDLYGFPSLWILVAAECLVGAIVFLLFGSDPPRTGRSTRRPFIKTFRKPSSTSKIYVLCLSFSIFLLGFALLGPNLNVYLFEDLGLSRTMIGITSFAGTGVTTLIQPILGSYSDKYGRKPFLIFGALNLALGNLVLFLARSLPEVFVTRILISNYNIFNFIGSAYISDIVAQKEKSAALGFFGSVGSASRSLGAIVGGYIIAMTSIPTLILVSSIFPALSIGLVLLLLDESKGKG